MVVLIRLQQKWSDLVVWLGFGKEISFEPPFPSQNLSARGQIFTKKFYWPNYLKIVLNLHWHQKMG